MDKKILYIIRGLPGAGKTTLAQLILKGVSDQHKCNAINCEADQYFEYVNSHTGKTEYIFDAKELKNAHKYCIDKTESAMKVKIPTIVVSNTFIRKNWMDPYKNLANTYGYDVVEVSVASNFKNVHNVPHDVYERMKKSWEA